MNLHPIFAFQINHMASENIIEEKKQDQALITENNEENKKKIFIESSACYSIISLSCFLNFYDIKLPYRDYSVLRIWL